MKGLTERFGDVMRAPLDPKSTLNLPSGKFPMKASLPQNEPKQLEAWQNGNIYERILETRKGKPLFVLHDGPPYPTGEIHLGTGLNKILKDPNQRSSRILPRILPWIFRELTKNPQGFYQRSSKIHMDPT